MLKPLNLKKSALALPLLGLIAAGCGNNAGATGSAGGGTGDAGASIDVTTTIAKVGDESITRNEMFTFLEAQAGEAALRQLVDYHLVMQEAKAKGVTIADADVDAELARRQETTPALAEIVKAGGPKLDAYKRQLRSQMSMESLITQDIKADPKAVEAWLNSPDPAAPGQKTRARYDKPATVKLGILLSSQKARADVLASQLKGGKSFSDLVAEQKKANDSAAKSSMASTADVPADAPKGTPPPANGGYVDVARLPDPLKAPLAKIQVNQTTPVVEFQKPVGKSAGAYSIVQLLGRKPEVKVKATDPSVLLDYKLTQSAQKVITKVQPKSTVADIVKQIIQKAQQDQMAGMQTGNIQPIPTYRQAIDTINQSAIQELLSKLRTGKAGNVSFPDTQYASLADSYKPVPTPAPIAPAAGGVGGAPGAGGAPSASGAPAGGAPSAGGAPAAGGAPSAGGAPAAGGAASGGASSGAPAAGASGAASKTPAR